MAAILGQQCRNGLAMQSQCILLALLLSNGACVAQQPAASTPASVPAPTRAEYLKLAAEVQDALYTEVINVWFPRSVDHEHGGFLPTSRATGIGRQAMASHPSCKVV
jgi:hypothetical protein